MKALIDADDKPARAQMAGFIEWANQQEITIPVRLVSQGGTAGGSLSGIVDGSPVALTRNNHTTARLAGFHPLRRHGRSLRVDQRAQLARCGAKPPLRLGRQSPCWKTAGAAAHRVVRRSAILLAAGRHRDRAGSLGGRPRLQRLPHLQQESETPIVKHVQLTAPGPFAFEPVDPFGDYFSGTIYLIEI